MVSNERVRPPFAAALLTLGLVTSCDALYGTPAKGSSPVAGASGTGAMAGNAGRGQAGAGSGGGLAGVGGSAAVGGAGGTSGIAGMAVGSGGSAAGGPGGVGNGAEGGGSGAGGMGGGAAGRGGTLGSGGVAGGGLGGSGGFARGGATGTGGAGGTVGGTGGVTGSAGSNAAFSGGPCVTSTDSISVETFARGVDQRIHRRVFSNARWGAWADIQGLDATSIDARSDLDCAAVSDAVHLVASGTKPVGAILHAFGFGTSYNPFLRELPSAAFSPSPSITIVGGGASFRVGAGLPYPEVYDVDLNGDFQFRLTPITTQTSPITSGLDLATEVNTTLLVAYEGSATLALHRVSRSSGGASWFDPIVLPAPVSGGYSLTPTICVENNQMGGYVHHVVVVAAGNLWHAAADWSSNVFSTWERVSQQEIASSPDCASTSNGTVHIVALGPTGTVLDVSGKTGSWSVTDLGTY